MAFGKLEEQAEAVAVGRHGLATGVALGDEAFQEKRLHDCSERDIRGLGFHKTARSAAWAKRCPARARSCGIAVTYQYVSETLAWPT